MKAVICCFTVLLMFFVNAGFSQITTSNRDYFLSKKDLDRLSPHSLNRYSFIVYSQYGEDGVINEIFNRLGIKNGFFVEFGAADGVWLSNTRYLWEQGWSGAMIEPGSKYNQLVANYKNSNVLCIKEFVSWEEDAKEGLTFDKIKEKYFADQEIDLLSVDVDGLDYQILKSLKCRPKVIMVECNLYWHPLFTKEVPTDIAVHNLQQPLAVMIKMARELGYEPVCATINLFLVRKDLYEPFKKCPSDALTLWRDGFRANPLRDIMWQDRNKNKLIRQTEDPELEKICPLSPDF